MMPNTLKIAPSRQGRRSATRDGPDPIDTHVGGRVRLRRILLGMTQQQLGIAIGLTFQQVQKYERGANRVSASMLSRIAQVLDVPVSFFFDGMAEAVSPRPTVATDELLTKRESLDLLRHYHRLAEAGRKTVFALVKAMADARPEEGRE